MSTLGKAKRLEALVFDYFGHQNSRGIIQVLIEEDGTVSPQLYHDRVTGKEIPGMYDKLVACKTMDELRDAVGKHGSNLPKKGASL